MPAKIETMTDQQIAAYAVSRTSLPQLSKGQRAYCATQIVPPLAYQPHMTDKALAVAVVASWSGQAAKSQQRAIHTDLAVQEYFHGDPEVPTQSPARAFLATFFLATMTALCVIGIVLWIFL